MTSSSQTGPGRGRKVLVIDDSEITRSAIEAMLTAAGYVVRTMESPLGATSEIVQQGIEILICDVNMPVMSGTKFAEVLKNNQRLRHVRLVLITGESDTELERVGAALGADAVLRKHALPERLVETLARFTGPKTDTTAVAPSRRKVLIVEDDRHHARVAASRLEAMGYDVTTRPFGKGTLVAVMDEKPIAILVSAELSDMPATAVIEAIRESRLTERIPVILYGALPEPKLMVMSQKCGATGSIHKSASDATFRARFDGMVAKS